MGKIDKPVVRYINEPRIEIKNVSYRGKVRNYDLLLTPTEHSRNLEETCEWSARQREEGNPYVPSSREMGLLLNSIANSGDEKSIFAIQKMLRENIWLKTASAIDCFPSGNAKVFHNLDLDETFYNFCKNAVGDDGEILKTPNTSNLIKSAYGLEVADMDKVAEIINGTSAYLWRENSNSDKKIRKGVGLVADSDRLYLGCGGNPLDCDRAFRVL